MTQEEEQIIIKKVIAGDTPAFSALVNHYKDMAVLLAYNILLNQEDAEETAQDSFVRACICLHLFRAKARFSTWLYRIVVNMALNRKKIKKHHVVEVTEAIDNELYSDTHEIYARHISAEHRKHIRFALQSLDDKERLCITLFYLNELSVGEIHELTGISTSNIKVLLFRGRKNLYTALNKYLKNEITNLLNQL
jgi:RNA polymerase sigma-70 factor (ECF subfamily)